MLLNPLKANPPRYSSLNRPSSNWHNSSGEGATGSPAPGLAGEDVRSRGLAVTEVGEHLVKWLYHRCARDIVWLIVNRHVSRDTKTRSRAYCIFFVRVYCRHHISHKYLRFRMSSQGQGSTPSPSQSTKKALNKSLLREVHSAEFTHRPSSPQMKEQNED